MPSRAVSLDDKYKLERGRIFVTGTQALVRLAMTQRRRDLADGLDTRGFVSGYRGSPLGGLDQALERAKPLVDQAGIVFRPGLNEDLAATAVLGTQQIGLFGEAKHDGVFALWYAKGPGVDRSGDALRHGNLWGSAPHGGVLLLAGDDHTCKSSTTSHQSEFAFVDAMIPVLNPAGVQEIIAYGLYGWALSRYAGTWSAMKLIAETVDSAASVEAEHGAFDAFARPTDFEMPPGGPHIRWPDPPQEQERRLHNLKLPAVAAFARANRIDRVTLGGPRRRLGIVATGKSYLDVMQALDLLGVGEERARELGISIYKVGLVWPLEREGLIAFARGLEELLVVEEKRSLVEQQAREQLYDLPADQRPRILGKRDGENRILLPAHDDLSPVQIARAIASRLLPVVEDRDLIRRFADLAEVDAGKLAALPPVERTPYFCSGCPHSTSTRVPEGSRAMAGIGCHWMSTLMDRSTATYTHMGAEGANFIGQAPFVTTGHVFQNLGDGTYFHSGLLAIRAAVAAKVNITYKILFNDAVAMTGGQTHDGELSPQRIAQQVRAEGVERIAVVSDDIEKYAGAPPFPARVAIHHRDDLEAVQRELRETPGVTVIVYDQTCAAEKRRRRKKAAPVEIEKRVVINELVCEGCGDCSVQSNCLSVVPLDTEFGTKRAIDQSSCNKDFSCLKGFCPSFVTVEGGRLRRPRDTERRELPTRPMPEPDRPGLERPYNVLVTGVGGTGVVTIGAILAMAAHIEGLGASTLDMTGMAQKGGPVTTHLRFARRPEELHAVRIPAARADLVLGCDLVVSAGKECIGLIAPGATHVLVNVAEIVTGTFTRDRDFRIPKDRLVRSLHTAAGEERVEAIEATRIVTELLGDSIATNLFMVGLAYQRGRLPVSAQAIKEAIELNGAAVPLNLAAFGLGRLAAHDAQALASQRPSANSAPSSTLEEMVRRRAEFLTGYQDASYAEKYRAFVERVRVRESEVLGQAGELTSAVAQQLFRLMAIKDEYEVARLHSSAPFREQLDRTFEGAYTLRFHLAPPLLARRDPVSGVPRKTSFGPWMMRAFQLLAPLKRLRGTRLDPFGWTVERQAERAFLQEYLDRVTGLLADLSPANHGGSVAQAMAPEEARGYGHVRAAGMARVRERWRQFDARSTDVSPERVAAE